MTNRHDAPYEIEAKIKNDPEIQFILKRIKELKAAQSSELQSPFDYSDEARERGYNDFALQLQINALEKYIEQKSLKARLNS